MKSKIKQHLSDAYLEKKKHFLKKAFGSSCNSFMQKVNIKN